MTEPTLRVRPAARVVLLDPDDRVLLMRYDDAPPNGSHWSTPGGGLNDGEDQIVHQVERLYLARTDQPRRQIRGVEAMHASDGIAGWRWWTLAELDTTSEAVWPAGLATLIRDATRP